MSDPWTLIDPVDPEEWDGEIVQVLCPPCKWESLVYDLGEYLDLPENLMHPIDVEAELHAQLHHDGEFDGMEQILMSSQYTDEDGPHYREGDIGDYDC